MNRRRNCRDPIPTCSANCSTLPASRAPPHISRRARATTVDVPIHARSSGGSLRVASAAGPKACCLSSGGRSSVPFFARHGCILRSIVDHMLTRICLIGFALLLSRGLFGQTTPGPTSSFGEAESSGTSTDLFVMFGSDLVRPGLLPKADYNTTLVSDTLLHSSRRIP